MRVEMGNKQTFTTDDTKVKSLSKQLNEPEWLLNNRLEAFKRLNQLQAPIIERVDYFDWDLWKLPSILEKKSEGNISKIINEDLQDKNILISNFEQATVTNEDLFSKLYHEAAFTRFENLFQAFTMAYLTDSLFIYIPENTQAIQPLELTFELNNLTQKQTNRQVLIYAGANSAIEIIERYTSMDNEEKASANIAVQILADTGANIQYTSFDQFSENTTAFVQREATTKKDATVNFAIGVMSEGDVIEDIQVHLEGQGSSSDVKTVVLSYQNQIQAVNASVTNIGSHTIGNIFQHGVALDASTVAFNGIGHILKDSKHSDAQQESRVLMLSDEARADANPILLIDEYEVQAGHAASVSRVDQDQLYYLMSRGLARTEAEKLIIGGFLGIVLSEISVKEVREEFIETIDRKLANYES